MGYFNQTGATKNILGVFQEKQHGNWFQYRLTNDEWALKQGFTHEIAVAFDEKRYAKVKKTVVEVAIDEGENGKAVIEKWFISRHHRYPN